MVICRIHDTRHAAMLCAALLPRDTCCYAPLLLLMLRELRHDDDGADADAMDVVAAAAAIDDTHDYVAAY